MRYSLISDDPTQEAIMQSNPATRVIFDPFLPVLQARAIMTAAHLGVFKGLGNNSCRAIDLARNISCDPEVLCMLLNLLVCAGYCLRDEDHYRLTDLALATLLPDSPTPLSSWVEHNLFHWDIISNMEEVVRTGRGIDSYSYLDSSERWATYQQAMLETARPVAPLLASLIPVPEGADCMLDIGGSHGLYGAQLCREHPPMRSVVLDLPEAVEYAADLTRQEGIEDIVAHRAGDALVDDLGEQCFDVVLVANLVHHFTDVQNNDLFNRIRGTLKSGGTVAIWDFQPGDDKGKLDLAGSGLALFWRLSSTSRCHPLDEQIMWLRAAGFEDITVHPTPMPVQVLLTGRAP